MLVGRRVSTVRLHVGCAKCHDDLSMGVKRDDAGLAWEFLAVTTGSDTGSSSPVG